MPRAALEQFIWERYRVRPDCPWARYPNYQVFRHPGSRKWFAVVMDVPKCKLGLAGEERLDAMNLKCGPLLTGSLLTQPGFYPAYHMGKGSWITVALDGTVPREQLAVLLDISYQATGPKAPKA